MRIFLLVLFLLGGIILHAQDVTGTWQVNSPGHPAYTTPSKVVVEIQQSTSGRLTGVSHYYYPGNYYEHYSLSGSIDPGNRRVYLLEDSLINVYMQPGTTLYNGAFQMNVQVTDTLMVMSGKWVPVKPGHPSIIYQFQKKQKTQKEVQKIIKKTVVSDRSDKVMKIIELDKAEADSVTIEVYDNGEVDGDTITVFVNNVPVINAQKISTKPITFKTSVSKENPITQIRMIANNLGSIPPNTALMIITTKKNRYTASLSSDFKTNGVLELFLKE